MNVLVINCGSSSLKYQLIDSVTEDVLAKGLCERIGIDGSQLVYQKAGCDKIKTKAPMPSHQEAISLVLNALMDPENGVIKSLDEIGAAGHRIVHGGEKFTESVVIDDEDTPLSDIDIDDEDNGFPWYVIVIAAAGVSYFYNKKVDRQKI